MSLLAAGKMFDLTGSYDVTLYIGGSCLLVGALLQFLLHMQIFKPLIPKPQKPDRHLS